MPPVRDHAGNDDRGDEDDDDDGMPPLVDNPSSSMTYTFFTDMTPFSGNSNDPSLPTASSSTRFLNAPDDVNTNPIPITDSWVTAPPTRTHARRRDASYIPRPPNAFILFRSSFIRSEKVTGKVEGNHSTLSKIIGMLWKALPREEREEWEAKAVVAQAEHRRLYPHWRFRPGSNAMAKLKVKDGGTVRRRKKGPDEDDDDYEPEGKAKAKAKSRPKKAKGTVADTRIAKIADLLVEGKKGLDLEVAVEEWEVDRKKAKGKAKAEVPVAMEIDKAQDYSNAGPSRPRRTDSSAPRAAWGTTRTRASTITEEPFDSDPATPNLDDGPDTVEFHGRNCSSISHSPPGQVLYSPHTVNYSTNNSSTSISPVEKKESHTLNISQIEMSKVPLTHMFKRSSAPAVREDVEQPIYQMTWQQEEERRRLEDATRPTTREDERRQLHRDDKRMQVDHQMERRQDLSHDRSHRGRESARHVGASSRNPEDATKGQGVTHGRESLGVSRQDASTQQQDQRISNRNLDKSSEQRDEVSEGHESWYASTRPVAVDNMGYSGANPNRFHHDFSTNLVEPRDVNQENDGSHPVSWPTIASRQELVTVIYDPFMDDKTSGTISVPLPASPSVQISSNTSLSSPSASPTISVHLSPTDLSPMAETTPSTFYPPQSSFSTLAGWAGIQNQHYSQDREYMYSHHSHTQNPSIYMHPQNRDPVHTHTPSDWYRAEGWAAHTTDLHRPQLIADADEWDQRDADVEVGRRETTWGMRLAHTNSNAKYQLNTNSEEWDRLEMESQFARGRKDEARYTGRLETTVDASRFSVPLPHASDFRGLGDVRSGQAWSAGFAASGHTVVAPTPNRARTESFEPSGTANQSHTRRL